MPEGASVYETWFAAAVMGALSLESDVIQRIFKERHHALQKARSIALNLFRKNLPLDTIDEVTELSIEQLQNLET